MYNTDLYSIRYLEILPMQLNDCAVKWSLNYSSQVAPPGSQSVRDPHPANTY